MPVAGFGTRFLPITKALPKEMLPVVDKPVVQYIVEELVASGIPDIIFVTGQNKRAVEDHFDFHPELEAWLEKTGKDKALAEVRKIASLANFVYIRQKGPYGNGTPVLNARHLIGNEPFVVVWADEFFINREKPRVRQLVEIFEKYSGTVLTAVKTDDEGTKRYAIIEGTKIEEDVLQITKMVEKPGPKATKSRLASVGGYVLTSEIFDELEKTPVRNQELWLADAIASLGKKQPLYAKKVEAEYYDVGSRLGWYEANLKLGLKSPELGGELKKLIKNLSLDI